MNPRFAIPSIALTVILVAALPAQTSAQDTERAAQTVPSQTSITPTPGTDVKPAAPSTQASSETNREQQAVGVAPSQGGLSEIFRMLDAGVSKEVVRMFIQNSRTTYDLSADDVIALKRRGISDDITTALLHKGAEVKNPDGSARSFGPPGTSSSNPRTANPLPAPVFSSTGLNYGGLDPDSYGYFYHYYLHPRTLAAAYQRLGMYGSPYGPGNYRPWGPSFAPGYARYPYYGGLPGWGY